MISQCYELPPGVEDAVTEATHASGRFALFGRWGLPRMPMKLRKYVEDFGYTEEEAKEAERLDTEFAGYREYRVVIRDLLGYDPGDQATHGRVKVKRLLSPSVPPGAPAAEFHRAQRMVWSMAIGVCGRRMKEVPA